MNRSISKENINDGSSRKSAKLLHSTSKHAYLSIPDNAEDEVSYGRHLDMLTSELAKPTARQCIEVLKPLMTSTFPKRRAWILDSTAPKSVSEITGKLQGNFHC